MVDWKLSPSEQLLCDCVQISDLDLQATSARKLVNSMGVEKAFRFADRNEVASHVAHALGAQANTLFRDQHERVASRMTAYMRELDRVAARLDEHNIPIVALKNAGIARGIYPCLGCSPMGDLDVMVQRRDFRRAHDVLASDGFQFEFRSQLEENDFVEAERAGGTEYWRELDNEQKLWLELQWRPVAGRWIQPDQEPDSSDLMARSIGLPDSKVRLLSPEDNLLQVALHTAKHTYVRAPGFRLHTDVDRIVAKQRIDWKLFVRNVKTAKLCTAVYLSLTIPACILGTQIPEDVLQTLKPASWKLAILNRWIRNAGLFDPDQQKFGRGQYVLFNALLYDRFDGLLRAAFPDGNWMLERYERSSRWNLPTLYIRRILNLVLRRENT